MDVVVQLSQPLFSQPPYPNIAVDNTIGRIFLELEVLEFEISPLPPLR